MKSNTITRKESRNRPEKGKLMAEKEEKKIAMMCWENLTDPTAKESYEESENEGEKPIKKKEKPKHEEEHVEPTLNTGN